MLIGGIIINGKSSTTIPKGSRVDENQLETVALFYFYVLKDPRDGLIKYVGRTVDKKNRFRNHIYESKKNNRTKKERWIVSLLRRNLKPEMEVFFELECSLNEAIELEKIFVLNYSKKYELKNMPDNYLGAVLTGTKVYQYDLITRELLGEFANASQASLLTGVKDSNIGRCCKNQNGYGTKTAGGFFWSFEKFDKYPFEYLKNWRQQVGKPVYQYNLNGVFLREFETARKAEKSTGVSYKKISACCNGRQKSGGGFLWKFKNNKI